MLAVRVMTERQGPRRRPGMRVMCDSMSDKQDAFRRRLRDALQRVPRAGCGAAGGGGGAPAAGGDGSEGDAAAKDLGTPRDEFEERLMRAVERTRGADGSGDGGSQRPAVAGQGGGAAQSSGSSGEASDDLRLVVESWPELPPFVKSFIVTMVQANRKPQAAA